MNVTKTHSLTRYTVYTLSMNSSYSPPGLYFCAKYPHVSSAYPANTRKFAFSFLSSTSFKNMNWFHCHGTLIYRTYNFSVLLLCGLLINVVFLLIRNTGLKITKQRRGLLPDLQEDGFVLRI
jgi:hypothetical protein